MKNYRKGITLLITTIALSVVTVTSAVFSGIYFRYGKMNTSYIKSDNEKITLRNNINMAYENFLRDTEVTVLGVTKRLRTDWLLAESGYEYKSTLSVTLSNFVANFRIDRADKTLFGLFVSSDNYTINCTIEKFVTGYEMSFINFDRKS